MVRFTTPTFVLTFEEDFDFTEPGHVYVTLEQGYVSLTKKDEELDLSQGRIDVFLSQAETGQFREGELEIMVNWTYTDGRLRGSSDITKIKVTKNLLGKVAE